MFRGESRHTLVTAGGEESAGQSGGFSKRRLGTRGKGKAQYLELKGTYKTSWKDGGEREERGAGGQVVRLSELGFRRFPRFRVISPARRTQRAQRIAQGPTEQRSTDRG